VSKSNAGRIGVWGASGSGKSAYVKKAIKGMKRVVVFDPLDEYSTEGMQRCRTVDEVRVAMVKKWKTFRIAYVPPAGREPRALSQIAKLLMVAQMPYKSTGKGQGITFVVEEMNLSFPVHGGDAKARHFADICSRGRHYGITVYGLSQRIAEVSTRFRGNCTQSIVLRQQGPRDIQAAVDASGATRAEVMALKNLDYIAESNGERTNGRIKF